MEKLTMSVKELAAAMSCSLPKAYELTEREGFPVIRLGRKKVIPLDGFRRWMDEQAGGGSNTPPRPLHMYVRQ